MDRGSLAYLLAVAMVGVACFHTSRLVLAARWHRRTEVDVDIVHMVMGVAMAGMLTGWLAGAWNEAWMVVFAAATIWFGRGLARRLSGERPGLDLSHHLPHFVVSAVMLYMLWAMRWTPMTGSGAQMSRMSQMSQMSMAGDVAGGLLLPTVVAVLVVANAAITAWGAFASTPVPAVAQAGTGAGPDGSTRRAGVIAARGARTCLLIMSVAMAYMVVAVHP